MNKRILFFMTFLLPFLNGWAESKLVIDQIVINPGEIVTVPINLQNDEQINGGQFVFTLPDGFALQGKPAIVADRVGEYELDGEMEKNGMTVSSSNKNGVITFLFVDQDKNAPFEGNSGPIITFKLKASADVAYGIHKIKVTKETLSNVDGVNNFNAAPYEIEIKVPYPKHEISVTNVENVTVTGAGVYEQTTAATLKAEVTHAGYQFASWNEGETVLSTENPYTFTVEKAMEITPVLAPKNFTVTYTIDGVAQTPTTVAYGTALTELAAAEKAGYTFSGWTWNTEDKKMPATMPAFDLTATGTYVANNYLVQFVSQFSEDPVFSADLPFNSVITAPADPEEAGYTFEGWYNGDVKFEAGATVPLNGVTYTAKFTPIEYDVVFLAPDANTPINVSKKVAFGSVITAPEASTDKTGHTFAGWFTKDDVKFEAGKSTVPVGGVTYEAKYTVNKYKLSYTVDGEAYGETEEVEYGAKIELISAPEKEGYTFSDWTGVPADGTMPAEDVVISGAFTVNSYTLNFIVENEPIKTLEVEYGTALSLDEFAPEVDAREGYDFSWSEMPATMPAKTVDVTGTYVAINYLVKFVSQFSEEPVFSANLPFNSVITAPADPEEPGYTFDGWYNGEVKFEAGATVPLNGVTYTAKFTPIEYDVVFLAPDANTPINVSKKVAFGSVITAPEASTDKTGHTFYGWFTKDDVKFEAGKSTVPVGGVTYTAKYTVNKWTLSYTVDGKAYGEPQTVEYGAKIEVIAAPEKEGHTFSGWTGVPENNIMPDNDVVISGTFAVNNYHLTFVVEDKELVNWEVPYGTALTLEKYAPEVDAREGYVFSWSEVPATMPAKDVTITGTFIEDSFKLSYYDGFAEEGTFIKSVEMKYNAVIEPIAAPEHEGYTFTKWEGMPEDLKMPAKDLTVYSKYAINSYKLTFKVDGEVVEEKTVEFNSAIVEPEVAAKEGHSFAWEEHVAKMPAKDLTINGAYTVNYYDLTFVIGESVISKTKVAYGAAITAPDAPAKEGHTFAGWTNVPATMPAKDVVVNGSYTVNVYTVVWKLDGETLATANVPYGETLPAAPAVPEKPGFTFSGWSEAPATMPANDVVITGSYVGGKFLLTWVVEGKVIRKDSVDYDKALPAAPAVDARTGHSFAWTGLVEKMPAKDVVVTGVYSINTYVVRYYLDGELFKTVPVVYNAVIPDYPEAPEKEGHIFMGWDRQPTVMPASDLDVSGYYIRAYIHVANNNYQTLSLDFDADIPYGVAVYSAALSADEKSVVLTKEDIDVLPKNTAVVIKAYTSEYIFVESLYNPDKLVGKNILKPTGDGTETLVSLRLTEAYMIGNNANGELSFCKYTSSKALPANQGYFEWKSNKTAPASLVIDDGTTTRIEGLYDNDEDAVYYDLSGRRINKTAGTHGVVIRKSANGNKAIVR